MFSGLPTCPSVGESRGLWFNSIEIITIDHCHWCDLINLQSRGIRGLFKIQTSAISCRTPLPGTGGSLSGRGGVWMPPSGVRLSISVCPIELISPSYPCPVPTAPPVGTVQGGWRGGGLVDLFAGFPGDPSVRYCVQVRARGGIRCSAFSVSRQLVLSRGRVIAFLESSFLSSGLLLLMFALRWPWVHSSVDEVPGT